MEKGGKPIRNVIVAGWRFGSTFLGDIITSHPAIFHFFEPLFNFGYVQIRGSSLDKIAISNIYALLNCKYTEVIGDYLNIGKNNTWAFDRNSQLWQVCKNNFNLCWYPTFLTNFCKLIPFQTVKFTRLRLNVAETLLDDKSLGIRMVLLVRDPRGVMQSRYRARWCRNNPNCSDPSMLCADLVANYKFAVELIKKYTLEFTVLRYEDLSVDPFVETKKLLQFYGLDFHNNIIKFLQTHTKQNIGNAWSTHRDSQHTPFHWKNRLHFEQVAEIQSVCEKAMNLWGYVLAKNETHLRSFHPVTKYQLV